MISIDQKQNNYCTAFNTTNTSVTNYFLELDGKLDNDNISTKNIVDRQITNVIATDTINFKKYNQFPSIIEMLDYFFEEITKIYFRNGVKKLNHKIEYFICYNKKIKFKDCNGLFYNAEDLYNFLCKLSLFIEESFKTPYNKISDAIYYFFRKCTRSKSMRKDVVFFLKDTPFADIHKIANCKYLYRYIKNQPIEDSISYERLQEFYETTNKVNDKNIIKIAEVIAFCNSYLKKQIIIKYVNEILQVCTNKNIDINNAFVEIIKELVTCVNMTDADIEAILKKIIVYLQAIANKNFYINIDILTCILCDIVGKTSAKLLLSIYNATDVQLQSIAVNKYLLAIISVWYFKGFPATEIINERVKIFNNETHLDTSNQQLALVTSLPDPSSSIMVTRSVNNVLYEDAAISVDDIDIDFTYDDFDLYFMEDGDLISDFLTDEFSDFNEKNYSDNDKILADETDN